MANFLPGAGPSDENETLDFALPTPLTVRSMPVSKLALPLSSCALPLDRFPPLASESAPALALPRSPLDLVSPFASEPLSGSDRRELGRRLYGRLRV